MVWYGTIPLTSKSLTIYHTLSYSYHMYKHFSKSMKRSSLTLACLLIAHHFHYRDTKNPLFAEAFQSPPSPSQGSRSAFLLVRRQPPNVVADRSWRDLINFLPNLPAQRISSGYSRRPTLLPQNGNDNHHESPDRSTTTDKRSLLNMAKTMWEYIQRKQQYTVVLLLYLFHLFILTQNELVFPVQVLPSKKGHFAGVGWDSLAGMLTMLIYQYLRRRRISGNENTKPSSTTTTTTGATTKLPSITANPSSEETPWHLPRDNPRFRLTSVLTAMVLVNAYFATGRFSIFWEDTLYDLSGLGFPITAPMQRSLCVLLGHLSWLVLGALLLRWLPRPPKFFQSANHKDPMSLLGLSSTTLTAETNPTDATETSSSSPSVSSKRPHVWFRSCRKSKWLWWVIGGYFVSSWLFNIADLVNQYILPEAVLEDAQESVVSQLVNPEHNDWLASAVGYIAPCITAPWWEEILYRGFALAGLTQLFSYRWAVFLQGVIFSAHHMSLSAALPLAVLGWTWAVLYTKSRNLWVVVAVHALWNSRVFLGSWMGL